jgi:hypothetical protein
VGKQIGEAVLLEIIDDLDWVERGLKRLKKCSNEIVLVFEVEATEPNFRCGQLINRIVFAAG